MLLLSQNLLFKAAESDVSVSQVTVALYQPPQPYSPPLHATRSQIAEREIQNSSEAMSVTNLGFVGEGVGMIVVAWTHLKGSGVGEV